MKRWSSARKPRDCGENSCYQQQNVLPRHVHLLRATPQFRRAFRCQWAELQSLCDNAKIRVGRGFSACVAIRSPCRSWLQSLCGNPRFSSGHGFIRAANAEKSMRLQPLRDDLAGSHTDPSATIQSSGNQTGFITPEESSSHFRAASRVQIKSRLAQRTRAMCYQAPPAKSSSTQTQATRQRPARRRVT
jgi:hypothetical protein